MKEAKRLIIIHIPTRKIVFFCYFFGVNSELNWRAVLRMIASGIERGLRPISDCDSREADGNLRMRI
jgi:hypothetical protein